MLWEYWPRASDSPKSLGDVFSLERQCDFFAGFHRDAFAAKAKSVFRKLISVTADVEKCFFPHQFGFVYGDDASIIGDKFQVMNGFEFPPGAHPARISVGDFYHKRFCTFLKIAGLNRQGEGGLHV